MAPSYLVTWSMPSLPTKAPNASPTFSAGRGPAFRAWSRPGRGRATSAPRPPWSSGAADGSLAAVPNGCSGAASCVGDTSPAAGSAGAEGGHVELEPDDLAVVPLLLDAPGPRHGLHEVEPATGRLLGLG